MPQLEVATYTSQIFWLATCLVFLYVSLRYIFIPRLENSIDARRRRIEGLILDAEKLTLESDALNMKYSEEIKQIHLDAFQMHKKSVKEFEANSAMEFAALAEEQHSKLEKFRQEIEKIKNSFEKAIEKESDKLLEEMIAKVSSSKINSSLTERGKNG